MALARGRERTAFFYTTAGLSVPSQMIRSGTERTCHRRLPEVRERRTERGEERISNGDTIDKDSLLTKYLYQ